MFTRFIQSEAAGGIVLMASAALALVIANSPLAGAYFGVLATYLGGLSVLHWINDALMALFFLLVGLEIKRELVVGQLATWQARGAAGLRGAGRHGRAGADLCRGERGLSRDAARLGDSCR